MKASKTYRLLLWAIPHTFAIVVCLTVLIMLLTMDYKEIECTERGHQHGYVAKLLNGECYFNVHPNLWVTEEDYNSVTKINPLKEGIGQ